MSANPVIPQAGVPLIYETVDKAILEGLKRFAHTALERGFHPLPCRRKEKTPFIIRSANGDRLPTHGEIDGWDCDAVALVCNHVLVFDFDQAGAFWPKWSAKVQAERSDLWARLPIERSQNGGVHVVIRTKRPFLSQKLAHLVVEVSGPLNIRAVVHRTRNTGRESTVESGSSLPTPSKRAGTQPACRTTA